MTNAAVSPRSVLSALRFRAEANPLGSAIDLVWELPLDPLEDDPNIVIVRRERRFPGSNRRGILPRLANEGDNNDLTDGEAVYDSRTFQFDFRETREERFNNIRIETTRYYDLIGERRERQLSRTASREFTQASNGIETLTRATIRLTNYQSVQPGIIYYYTAFVEIDTQGQFYFSRLTQASALATGRYGHRLFTALPQIHQRLDTTYPASNQVTPGDRDKGQLQRSLEVFEAHADMLHGFVDGLRDLHNINRVDSQFLPHLAHYIGWHLQGNLNEIQQRNELRNAPELYKTIGTIPAIKAVINRFTGWDAEVYEYARNVLLTFDSSRLETLENGETVYLDGSFSLITPEPDEDAPNPPWRSRSLPQGSIDTTNTEALLKLRSGDSDDLTAYTYDSRKLGRQSDWEPNNIPFYNPKRIRINIIADRPTEVFSVREGIDLVREVVAEFLPINVEPVFFLKADFEELYNTIQEVQEELIRENLTVGETFSGVEETSSDRIPGWQLLITNDPEHTTVDTTELPIDTRSRTWHTALDQDL